MAQSRKDLTERYIRTSWIIKIRLMSSRRQLWDKQVSLIHLESACLQMRKVCECIAQLCLIAADINFNDIPRKLRKKMKTGSCWTGKTMIMNWNAWRMLLPTQKRISMEARQN